jgi:hypothetical protein
MCVITVRDRQEQQVMERRRLSKRQIADMEGVSTRTVERRVQDTPEFPKPEIINGRWKFWSDHYSAYCAWRSEQAQKPVPFPHRATNQSEASAL